MSKDLIVLVADVQQEKTLETLLLTRQESLGIRPVTCDIFRHPRKDAGVYNEAADFLLPYQPPAYYHALILLDHDWVGAPPTPEILRQALLDNVCRQGWDSTNCVVIVVAPELEAWVWSDSSWVPEVL